MSHNGFRPRSAAGKASPDDAREPPSIEVTLDAAMPAVDRPGSGFDPRESFYPTTLLKAEDVRLTLPKARPQRRPGSPLVKGLVALVLALSAALAYVLYSKPQEVAPKEAARAMPPEGKPTATGAITPTPAPAPAPVVTEAAKAPPVATAPPAAVVAKPPPRAATAKGVAQPAAPVAAGAIVAAPPGPRSTITHTKASSEASEAQKAAPPAAAVVATPPQPASVPAKAANCSDALAALGLCTPAK